MRFHGDGSRRQYKADDEEHECEAYVSRGLRSGHPATISAPKSDDRAWPHDEHEPRAAPNDP